MFRVIVIADSVSTQLSRITTMEVTFPRFILPEFNTHRAFSRNSASSRAIPMSVRMEQVMMNPFIPEQFYNNQAGMQGAEPLPKEKNTYAQGLWRHAAESAASYAHAIDQLGVHKQHAARLLEPFLWHTVVVTSTEWSNFFNLRDSEMAQPEFQRIAYMMREAYSDSVPDAVFTGGWHLPYVTRKEQTQFSLQEQIYVSVARCARVSYGRVTAKTLEEDTALYNRLLVAGHMSPFEHPAMAMAACTISSGNFVGWHQYRKTLLGEDDIITYMKNQETDNASAV